MSNNYEEHEKLHKRGIDVLILDHHNCDKYSDHAIVVNNQMCDYPNKDFSGVGITYKFCKAVDEFLEIDYADDYIDLVAIGNIADMIDTRSLETRYYIMEGLKNIKNPLIREIIKKQEYSTKGIINMFNIGFYITPLMNGTIRFGTQEEKSNMFKAMLEDCQDETLPYTKRGTTEEIQQPLAEAMARICGNVKSRQDRARDKGVAILEERIIEKELDKNKVLIVNSANILDESLSGLVANQLSEKYRRPTIILKELENKEEKEVIFGGSARGYEKGAIKDFQEFVLQTGCFQLAEGHDNAFGIEVEAKSIVKASEIMNERLKDYDFDDFYHVDFIVPISHLNSNLIKTFNDMKDIWGRRVDEPLLAVTDIILNSEDIQLMGKTKNTIKFVIGDIEFIKFKSNEEEYEDLAQYPTVKMELVGKCSLNEYNGNKTYQVIIEDYKFEQSNVFNF